jgi:hypothetical protein
MEEYLPPERRKQWQDAPIVELSFFLGGKKKTYVGYEAGVIERATVAALRCPSSSTGGPEDEATKKAAREEEAALARLQVHAFNLGLGAQIRRGDRVLKQEKRSVGLLDWPRLW